MLTTSHSAGSDWNSALSAVEALLWPHYSAQLDAAETLDAIVKVRALRKPADETALPDTTPAAQQTAVQQLQKGDFMTPDQMTDAQFELIMGYSRNPKPPKPFAKWEQPWNSMELSSYAAGRALVAAINAKLFAFPPATDTPRPMGGGVLPGDDENVDPNAPPQTFGLYIPQFFGLAPPAEVGPDGTKYFELHLRFANGAIIDVGLFLDKLSRYPLSQGYAVSVLAAEVEQSGRPT